jgi:hypothetical protein
MKYFIRPVSDLTPSSDFRRLRTPPLQMERGKPKISLIRLLIGGEVLYTTATKALPFFGQVFVQLFPFGISALPSPFMEKGWG